MAIKIFKHLFFIISIPLLQLAVIPNLPGILDRLNLILILVVFVSVVYQFYLGVIYAFMWGFILDSFSYLPFGAILIGLLFTLLVVYEVFEHFLTNKSFYTLLGLTAVATLIFNFIIFLYTMILYFMAESAGDVVEALATNSFYDFLGHLAMNVGLGALLFVVFNFYSRRFKAVFIDTTKN